MNPLLRSSIKFSSKIFRNAGANPTAMANILCAFPHKQIQITEKEIAWATKMLNSIYKNCDNSCITTEREVSSEYDLQIIIPAYNTEKYIGRCMESAIAAQTGKYKILITVVNDGSTDSTPDILEKYSGRKDIEIINQENRGFSGARNRALQNIRGRYITFLDSDDELGNINALLSEAIKADADIAEGSYELFTDSYSRRVKGRDINSDSGGYGILFGYPWGKVYKNYLFRNISFPESYWFEDTVGGMVLYHIAKRVVKRDILCYRYRINPNGISQTFRGKAKSCDSHWITERLMKDRAILGLDNNNMVVALMLAQQIRKNYSRISRIKRKNIELALFILSCDLHNRYIRSKTLKDNLVAESLKTGDFLKFRLACIMAL